MSAYEVELKFPLEDSTAVVKRLAALGARAEGTETQADTYFAHPSRHFEQTDEALRIRMEGEATCLTYKGPLLDAMTKSRREIELPLAGGPESAARAAEMLQRLGFEPVHTVRKSRTAHALEWEGRPFTLAVDRVDGLGDFLEIEVLAGPDDWEAARDAALRLAERLQLSGSERRSYLQLLLDRPLPHNESP